MQDDAERALIGEIEIQEPGEVAGEVVQVLAFDAALMHPVQANEEAQPDEAAVINEQPADDQAREEEPELERLEEDESSE